MVNIKKRIIVIISFFILTYTQRISAIEVYIESDGYTTPITLFACDSTTNEGCMLYDDRFRVRVTIVGNDLHSLLPNTKPIEFGYYGHDEGQNPFVNMVTNTFPEYDSGNAPLIAGQPLQFVGSSVSGGINEREIEQHVVYLGFDVNDDSWDDGFDHDGYSKNREKFVQYIKALERRQIHIDKPEFTGNVNFLDYLFKVSGFNTFLSDQEHDFSNVWNATSNNDFRNKLSSEKEAGREYHILIEPVLEYGVIHGGALYSARGTVKQLAQYAYNTLSNTDNYWFWPPMNAELMYNHYCGFLDDTYTFNRGADWRCNDLSNFYPVQNQTVVKAKEVLKTFVNDVYCNSKIPALRKLCTPNQEIVTEYFEEQLNVLNTEQVLDMLNDLQDWNSGMGINIVDISEIMPKEVSINTKCEFDVNLCKNNSFIIESKLKSSDLFHCIYPSENSIESYKLNNVSFKIENTDLWCYDDTTYNFNDIKNYFAKNNMLKKNQLVILPYGRLTVKRTCYSSKKEDFKTFLGGTEPNGSNYKETFVLNLNDENYIYRVDGTRYQFDNGNIRKNDFLYDETIETPRYETKQYYKYTTEFNYDIIPTTGTSATDSKISIIDYSISESLGNNNSIKIVSDDDGKIVKISNNKETKQYSNVLKADENNYLVDIGGKYMLGNKLYNTLSVKNSTETIENENIKTVYDKLEYETRKNGYIFKNEYKMTKISNPICGFSTEIKEGATLGGEGIQFRVISLSNPFPARDGTARIPGENWLGKNTNHVYTYITNNRNVQEDKIYSEKEPLYTITLDMQTMATIREFNKNYSYKDLSLSCTEGTGRECQSTLLRNPNFIKAANISGTCSGEINASTFYTCADKTVASGG